MQKHVGSVSKVDLNIYMIKYYCPMKDLTIGEILDFQVGFGNEEQLMNMRMGWSIDD